MHLVKRMAPEAAIRAGREADRPRARHGRQCSGQATDIAPRFFAEPADKGLDVDVLVEALGVDVRRPSCVFLCKAEADEDET